MGFHVRVSFVNMWPRGITIIKQDTGGENAREIHSPKSV